MYLEKAEATDEEAASSFLDGVCNEVAREAVMRQAKDYLLECGIRVAARAPTEALVTKPRGFGPVRCYQGGLYYHGFPVEGTGWFRSVAGSAGLDWKNHPKNGEALVYRTDEDVAKPWNVFSSMLLDSNVFCGKCKFVCESNPSPSAKQ